MGSITVAAWLAPLMLLALLTLGLIRGELAARTAVLVLLTGLAVWFTLPRMVTSGEHYVTSVLAAIDIVLVFAVFKGDVRIT